MTNDDLIAQLDNLTIEDWVTIVGQSADTRFRSLKHMNSNAGTFHTISRECIRLRKILKRITIG
jgi:hypothetical protein